VGGSGINNIGVFGTVAVTGAGGAITITGTPGTAGSAGISLASVAAGAGTITLSSTGSVTTSGALTAAKLALLGTGGSYTLTNAGNAVATLAANTGSVNYAQTGNLTIGTVGGTTGLTSSGTVLVNVTGSLTLASGAGVSAVGTGDALTLVDSTSFTNNVGAGALSVTGGGRWLVWSGNPANDTTGGLVYGFKQYGAASGITTPADSTNNGLLYSIGASLSASLTGTVSKVYDTTNVATLAPANYALAGVLDGDTVTITNPTAGTYDTIHVGTAKTVTVNGVSIVSATNGGATVYGYTLSSPTVSGAVGTITAAPLTADLSGTVSKVYDTTNTAPIAPANLSVTGVLGTDVVTVSGATGTYDTIHVGTGKTVTVTGLTLGGANAGDYQLGSTTTAAAVGVITPASLTASLTGSVSKVYDTTNTAQLAAGNYRLGGVLGSDVVALNNPAAGTYSSIHVGSGLTVTASGLAISGANAGDYRLVSGNVSGAIGTITPATLTAGLAGTVSKPYDGTDAATLTAVNYTLTGLLGNDAAGLNYPTNGLYATSQAGTGLMVTVNGLLLAGLNAGDYRLVSSTVAAPIGTILPAPTPASSVSTLPPPTVAVDVAIPQVVGQLAGATNGQPFMTKKSPPLWTITKKPTEPAGSVIVDP
jgi:hypothetical protein